MKLDRLLTAFFLVALVFWLGLMLVCFLSIPGYYERVTTQTVVDRYYGDTLFMGNQVIAASAAARGLSLQQYALYTVTLGGVIALIHGVTALLLALRGGRSWFVYFTGSIITFLGLSGLSEPLEVARLVPQELIGAVPIYWAFLLLFFFLFPNGMRAPRRVGWLPIGLVVYHLFVQIGTVVKNLAPAFAARYGLPSWGDQIFAFPVILNFLIVFACQVYRYRVVSTPVERQQTKWFLVGFAVTIAFIPVGIAANISTIRNSFLGDVAAFGLFTPLPITVAIAILRYRLFDIDLIIRRTLIYSVLTAVLALVYFTSVIVLQQLFRFVTGQSSDLAIILSTLGIAALFNRLRWGVQNAIDRRFYRRKYDAAQVLATFSAALRDEVELDRLTNKLLNVVGETMQPENISLWLRADKKEEGPG